MTRKIRVIPAAVALALGITGAASAHTPSFSVSCAGGLTVAGTQYSGGTVDITYGSRHQRTTFVTSFVLHVPTPDPTIVESYVVVIDAIDGTEFDHTYTGSVQPCIIPSTSTSVAPTSVPASSAPTPTTTAAPATTATSGPTSEPATTSVEPSTSAAPPAIEPSSSSTSTSDVAIGVAPPPTAGLPETGSDLVVPLTLFAAACFVTGLGLRRTRRRS